MIIWNDSQLADLIRSRRTSVGITVLGLNISDHLRYIEIAGYPTPDPKNAVARSGRVLYTPETLQFEAVYGPKENPLYNPVVALREMFKLAANSVALQDHVVVLKFDGESCVAWLEKQVADHKIAGQEYLATKPWYRALRASQGDPEFIEPKTIQTWEVRTGDYLVKDGQVLRVQGSEKCASAGDCLIVQTGLANFHFDRYELIEVVRIGGFGPCREALDKAEAERVATQVNL